MPAKKKTSKACSSGYIRRNPYTVKKGSKKIRVKSSCIRATSQSGRKTSVDVKKRLKAREKMYKDAEHKFGKVKCKKGSIVREGYKKASGTWVKPTCIKDVGKSGKVARTIYLEPDRLGKYGYGNVVNSSSVSRHKALHSAFEHGEKPLSVMRRLVALSTLSRNTNPRVADIFAKDADWVKNTPEYGNRLTNKKISTS